MPVKPQEILFYLSGGLSNRDVNKSLGGPMSNTIILNGANNLFDDLTSEEQYGHTDYRCFYIKNGSTDWSDVSIYLKNQAVNITSLLGIVMENNVQQFNVVSDAGAIGGSFSFKMGSYEDIVVEYDSDMNLWANNFQIALESIGFTDTIVTGQIQSNISSPQFQNKTFQIFQIEFTDYRNEELIEPDQNNLTMNVSDTSILTSSVIIKGSPINTEAVKIPNNTSSPPNVVFKATGLNSPVYLGLFKAEDVIPIWIQRTSANSVASGNSIGSVTVVIRGTDNDLF